MSPQKKHIILLGAVKSTVGGSLCVADDLHLFDKAGLPVKILWYQNGKEVLDALECNAIDVAFAGTVPYESMDHAHIKHIATIAEGNDTHVALRNKAKNIQKIGIIHNTASSKAWEAFQLSHKKLGSNIEILEMNAYDMPSNFARGLIDGFVIWEPFVSYAQSLLGNSIHIYDTKKDSYTWYMNLFAKHTFCKKQPILIENLIAIFFQANSYIQQYPTHSIETIASYIQVPSELISKKWKRYKFYNK